MRALYKGITKLTPPEWKIRGKIDSFFLMVSIGHLDGSYEFRNMRNRFSALEILLLAPKNIFKLILSSEISQPQADQVEFPMKIHTFSIIPMI